MGADLPPPGAAKAPSFVAIAAADPSTASRPGGDLERTQVIKGWAGEDGALHQAVFDVAVGESTASVDLATCEPRGSGSRLLCGVWTDPDFDPDRRAVYYVRVLENPSCRDSAWQCGALPPEERPPGCAREVMNPVQQERAWTSPLWYTPADPSS